MLCHPVEDHPVDCQQLRLMWRFFPLLWSPTLVLEWCYGNWASLSMESFSSNNTHFHHSAFRAIFFSMLINSWTHYLLDFALSLGCWSPVATGKHFLLKNEQPNYLLASYSNEAMFLGWYIVAILIMIMMKITTALIWRDSIQNQYAL